MTLKDYISDVRTRLPDETAKTVRDGVITQEINVGRNLVAQRLLCLERTETIAVVAATQEYTLPTHLLAVLVVYNTLGTVQPQSQANLVKRAQSGWTTNAGHPPQYYYIREGYAESGGTVTTDLKIGFAPIPSTDHTAYIVYKALPYPMSADADICYLPAETHDIPVKYACWQLLETQKDVSGARAYELQVERRLQEQESKGRHNRRGMSDQRWSMFSG